MVSKVAVASAYVGHPPEYLASALENHSQYCSIHRYDYHFYQDKDILGLMGRLPGDANMMTWFKPYILLDLFAQGYEYVFWTDTDSLFTVLGKSFGDLQERRASFIFTGDAWDLCSAGHLWFRNTAFSEEFLRAWLKWEGLSLPNLHTSHKNQSHQIADQPALNIQLHGGMHFDPERAVDLFNGVNGHRVNVDRTHKNFRWFFSPTRAGNLKRAQSLIHPSLSGECTVIVQSRLNSYPFRLWPAQKAKRDHPIVHFPGASKDQLLRYAARCIA